MPLQRTQVPSTEPITPAQAKDQIKRGQDFTDDDSEIKRMIAAARGYAENYLGRSLCPQKWRLILDSFPGPSLMGVPFGRALSMPKHAIVLERPPIRSIDSIQYLDTSSTMQTMPPSQYVDQTNAGTFRCDQPVRITPIFGQIWPINQPQIGSVTIDYSSGYDGPDVLAAEAPEIVQWLLVRVAGLYENREEIVVGSRITVAPLPFIDSMMDHYIVRRP
jgi:uncharacterized phiE125 gp8 family phage protein